MSTQPHFTVGVPRTEPARRSLFLSSLIVDVLMVGMLVLGLLIATGTNSVRTVHAITGYTVVVVAILVALAAWRFAKLTARKGVFWHAVSIPVLMIIQIGLAEMGVEIVHIILGIALLVAAIGLTMMVRKPIPATV